MAYTGAWQQFSNQLNDAYNQNGFDEYGSNLQTKLKTGQEAYSWDWDQDDRLRGMYAQQWNIRRQLQDAQKSYKANGGGPVAGTSNVWGPMTKQMMDLDGAYGRYSQSIQDLERQRYQAFLNRNQSKGANQKFENGEPSEPYGNAIRQMLK